MIALDQTDDATEELLAVARSLEADGRAGEAIRLLTEADRAERRARLEEAAVGLRHRAAIHAAARAGAAVPFDPPRAEPRPERSANALVVVRPADLDVAALRHGLAHQGCVLVKGLIPRDRAAALAAGIDRALAAFDAADAAGRDRADGEHEGWFAQFTPDPGGYRVGGRRKWVRASGALWTADSPRMFAELVDLLHDTGIGALVTDYLGERPALSANKCTLRRVPLDTNVGWHQDGSFLGGGVRSINLWLALGDCGRDAPGMDLVPRRIDHVVETGTPGAMFDWSVAPDVVAREAEGVGVVRPEFEAGDALLFDHLLLHSTCVEPTMTRERHAMETWLFAPSTYPEGQIPLAY